jgi:hypothetical protein
MRPPTQGQTQGQTQTQGPTQDQGKTRGLWGALRFSVERSV